MKRLALLACLAAALACGRSEVELLSSRCQTVYRDPTRFQWRALRAPDARSHWLQPWRAWSDTWPATRMVNAPVFSLDGPTAEAAARARLYAGAGMRRARIQIQWDDVDPANPTQLGPRRSEKRAYLAALAAAGVRPMLVLDAYAQLPRRPISLTLSAPAPKGSAQVRLDPASVARAVAGRTWLDDAGASLLEDTIFITSVDAAGVARLSRPLDRDLPAGARNASVWLYLPFGAATLPDGSRNPAFEESLQGWEAFLNAVAREVREVLGNGEVDLVVFNGIGSPVLDLARYYGMRSPPEALNVVRRALLDRTLAFVRAPANGLTGARVLDGFTNQAWTESGKTTSAGVAAFVRRLNVERGMDAALNAGTWLDATGRPSAFTPAGSSLFPELPLSGLANDRFLADLAPEPWTDAAGTEHGRHTLPSEPGEPPAVALGAFSLHPSASPGASLGAADARRIQTKSVLRTLSAYVGKGVESIAFYQPTPATQLAVDGQPMGGDTLVALGRFLDQFAMPAQPPERRSLVLVSVATCATEAQLMGDGTPAHPPLYDRDLVAFFPFELGGGRFVAPVYVMTRDLARPQPAAPFTLTVEGVRGDDAEISLFDPLDGSTVPVTVEGRGPGTLRMTLPLTDSPRVLRITER